MKNKRILRPERLRHVPRQFSWIDHRLVREHHVCGRSPRALALYLFLCTVADAQGMSYYSDGSCAKRLGWVEEDLRTARKELVSCGLIAYESPFYQVLSLEPKLGVNLKAAGSDERRGGEARSVGDILASFMKEPS